MQNLNDNAKSRGVLLFAYNTDSVDYVKIAERAARLIEHNLKLPVTIITDMQSPQTNERIGYKNGSQWFNGDRYRAYELSPYDETLLLDSDYLIFDNSLIKILDTVDDYKIMSNNQSPTHSQDGDMGALSLAFVWATAVVFKKTQKAKQLFDLVGRIQRNYEYYVKLYHLRENNFRNDYAFAIADNILSGYHASSGIPWCMLTIDHAVKKIETQNNKLIVREDSKAYIITRQNLHIMDKDYLLGDSHQKLLDEICL
jgi:hypothetical protein